MFKLIKKLINKALMIRMVNKIKLKILKVLHYNKFKN